MKIRKSSKHDNAIVHKMLQDYNSDFMEEGKEFSYCMEENGEIVAGIVADSLFDTVEVEYLWVKPEFRRKGYGKSLLGLVEQQAGKSQIRRILLNTYSFQAPGFYRKMGYRQLFEISPAFKDYSQYYFVKVIQ